MKSLINIDNEILALSKEAYILQTYGDKQVDFVILDKIDKAIECLKDNAKCYKVDGVYNLYFNGEFAYIKESNVLGGKNVSERLKGAKKAYFFVVTLGQEVDRLINKYQFSDLTFSYLLDGLASVLIDIISQKIQDKISKYYDIYERYSCGYGDYSLQLQANICELLNTNQIGVKLTNGGMFYPTKTISAVIGIIGEKYV